MRGTWQTTSGGPGGGGGVVLVVVIAALAVGSGAVSAAVSALVTIIIVIACLAAAAVLGGIGLLVYRTRQNRPGAVFSARPIPPVPPGSRPQVEETYKPAAPEIAHTRAQFPAIEPPQLHLHFHGMSPAEVAEAIRQANEKR